MHVYDSVATHMVFIRNADHVRLKQQQVPTGENICAALAMKHRAHRQIFETCAKLPAASALA